MRYGPLHARRVMVAEVFADPPKLVAHLDAGRLKHVRPANTGQFEELWRVDRAGADDDFTTGAGFELLPAESVDDPDAPLSLEQQALGQRVRLDGQVRAPARRVEVAHRGTHATTTADRRLRHADAILLRPVVVLRVGYSDLAGRFDQGTVKRAALVAFADPERPVAAAVLVLALAPVAFHLLEDRQHLAIAPAAIAELRPGVVVLRLAAHEHHAVDGRRAAQQFAARDRNAALAGAVVGLGGVQPVGCRVLDQLGEPDRDTRPGMASPACLQHQPPVPGIGAEPVGQGRPGRAGAHHDVIEDLAFHVELVVLR